MPRIQVTNDEFPNIVMAYLLDKFLHPNDVSAGNELFNKTAKTLKGKGLTSIRNYYLEMNPRDRVKYKIIKDAFEGLTPSISTIQIVPAVVSDKDLGKEKETTKKKDGIIKKVIKKVIKSLTSGEEVDVGDLELLIEHFHELNEIGNKKAVLYYGDKKLEDLGRLSQSQLDKIFTKKVEFYRKNGLTDVSKFKIKT